MYVNVFFVKRCLYSAVSLTLVKEQCFIRIIMIIIMMMIIILSLLLLLSPSFRGGHLLQGSFCPVTPTVPSFRGLKTECDPQPKLTPEDRGATAEIRMRWYFARDVHAHPFSLASFPTRTLWHDCVIIEVSGQKFSQWETSIRPERLTYWN